MRNASTDPSTRSAVRRRSTRHTFGWALIGILLLQAAWVFVVPPVRGLDESDHVFKAAATARGDWQPHHRAATEGWGEFMRVPDDIVDAARRGCENLSYTTPENCVSQAPLEDGQALVASSAARYNPVFYFVVGTAARPFEGSTALYAMRAATALLSALLLAAAVAVASSWAQSRWMGVALLLAITPITIYSSAIAAPNGVELGAAILLWASMLGLVRNASSGRASTRHLLPACVAVVVLATVRTLGPLWVVLIVGTCALLIERHQLMSLIRIRAVRTAAVVTGVLSAFGPVWSLAAGTNAVTEVGNDFEFSWTVLPQQWVVWLFQSIAAFPARDELAPIALYAVALVAMWTFLAIAWTRSARRERLAMVSIVVLTAAIGSAVTVSAYSDAGALWQGRYGYPYAVGVFLVAGWVLDTRLPKEALASWAVVAAGAVTVTTTSIGILKVLLHERRTSPYADTAAWLTPSIGVVVLLVVAGSAALTLAALSLPRIAHSPSPQPSPQPDVERSAA